MESKIFRKLFSLHQIAAGSSGKIILLRMSLVNLGLQRSHWGLGAVQARCSGRMK